MSWTTPKPRTDPQRRLRWRVRLPLRTKLLAASSLLLLLPFLGYRYVNEMEQYLRDGVASTLLGTARALAAALGEQGLSAELKVEGANEADIYVHRLPAPIQLDGYDEDWKALGIGFKPLHSAPSATSPSASPALGATLGAGVHDGSLYVLIHVQDREVAYAHPRDVGRGQSDHLLLTTLDQTGAVTRHVVDTLSPGWARTTKVITDRGRLEPARRAYRFKGEWREHTAGYTVELRLPFEQAKSGLRIDVHDVETASPHRLRASVSTAGTPDTLGRLVLASPRIEAALRAIGAAEGRRVWVVDQHARVRGRAGSLIAPDLPNSIHPWFRWLLTPPKVEEAEALSTVRLMHPVVTRALSGKDGASWQRNNYADAAIVTAAHSVLAEGSIVGAVVVEENAAPIQTVRRQALAELFVQTLIVACLAAVVLIWFASRIGRRLQRLRDEANSAIDERGRVVGAIASSARGDEIGDLGQSISGMLERLRRYNEYLEQLARRLSHELRTPIAVIRSSLDNLDQASPSEGQRYAERAKQGLGRLNTILSRMSEATRIEESLIAADREPFDLVQVARVASESYARVWPATGFEFSDISSRELPVYGVPDLLVQALDKLVENAVELGDRGEPVTLRVGHTMGEAWLEVDNVGPPLPAGLDEKVFDSLVTVRERAPSGPDDAPHLGLGLFIVRLIAEFHDGSVRAFPRRDHRGVVFRLSLPFHGRPR